MSQAFYRFLCLVFLIIATAGFMAELSGNPIKSGFAHMDKVAHFGIFFVLSGLVWKGFRPTCWKIVLLMAFYGVLVEVVQENYTQRNGDFWDWLADMAGVLAFFLIRKLWHLWRPRSKT